MRRASASSTDDARAVANSPRASPPESIKTTMCRDKKLPEDACGQYGYARKKVGAEFALYEFLRQAPKEWCSRDQRGKKREVGGESREMERVLQKEMQDYCDKGESGDQRFLGGSKTRLR